MSTPAKATPAVKPQNVALAPSLDFDFDKELQGFESVDADVENFWEPERGPIFGTVIGAKEVETDNGITSLYAVRLLRDCAARTPGDESIVAKAGSIIGVWYTYKLRALSNLMGAKVAIRRSAQPADIGGGKTMWNYDLRASAPPVAAAPQLKAAF